MNSHDAIAGLPEVYFQIAPELAELNHPEERTANCRACPMVRQPDEPPQPHRMVFHPTLRCCTYNPVLYNYLAGRVLRRGGLGAEKVRSRIAEGVGVNRWTIRPPMSFYERAAETGPIGFGTDASRKCPYWASEGLGCSIWLDRNAVCRAWHCRHDGGLRGREYWHGFRDLLRVIQVRISCWLVDVGQAPEEGSPGVEPWESWYLWCADRLDQISDDETATIRRDLSVRVARDQVVDRHEVLVGGAMPDVLGPAVTAFYPDGDHVILEGYSHYSPSRWPRTVYTLFSRMDGTRTWKQALADATELLGGSPFTEADVRELFRLGILEARSPEDLEPGIRLRGAPAGVEGAGGHELLRFDWPMDEPAPEEPG